MTFTVTEASIVKEGANTPYCAVHLDYTLNEPNGSKYRVRRSNVMWSDGRHDKCDIHVEQKTTAQLVQEIMSYEKRDHDPKKRVIGPYIPVASKKLSKAAPPPLAKTPAAPNPYQATATALQQQLTTATQRNTTLQMTIVQQNQNIASLKSQAAQMQQTITSLNRNIAALRAQVAVLPHLQEQITALQAQVASLTVVLNNILAQIQG
jgi:septal ring factor EnvC (AmiA/AmiB activator)